MIKHIIFYSLLFTTVISSAFNKALANQATDFEILRPIKLILLKNRSFLSWNPHDRYWQLKILVKDQAHIFGLSFAKSIVPEKNDHTGDDHVSATDKNGFGSQTSFLDDPSYFDENYIFWNKWGWLKIYYNNDCMDSRTVKLGPVRGRQTLKYFLEDKMSSLECLS